MKDGFQETEELVRRGGEGDQGALEQLFSRHRERLRRMVSLRLDWRLRRRLGEEDILQEVYLEAARRLGEYLRDPKLPFFLWLRFLTRQKLADTHRQHLGAQARDVRREVRLGQGALPDATSAALAAQLLGRHTTPSENVMRVELKLKLQEALESMDPEDREVLVLRHYEELTHSEIAQELGIERSTANKRYFRALMKIKHILAAMPGGPGESWTGRKD